MINRIPRPEFLSDYKIPETILEYPSSYIFEYADVAVLICALLLASYLTLKKRSRKYIFSLSLFSLLYFGFFREGCICPVGSIQNVTIAFSHLDYKIPVTVALFFMIPLLFSLYTGRTFCSGVCPFGAIQDLVILKPYKIPYPVAGLLSVLPYVYLAFVVYFAALGVGFYICRLDPFIPFFRMNGTFNDFIYGSCFILVGIFIARPYCRFMCPYGVLLGIFSRVSKNNVKITTDTCTNCGLCEDACPSSNIMLPSPENTKEQNFRQRKKFGLYLILIPFITVMSGFIFQSLSQNFSSIHPMIKLEKQIEFEDKNSLIKKTDESMTFRNSKITMEQLKAEIKEIVSKFRIYGFYAGAFIGLTIGLKLLGLSLVRRNDEYCPDHQDCFSCGRCFSYCPKDKTTVQKPYLL